MFVLRIALEPWRELQRVGARPLVVGITARGFGQHSCFAPCRLCLSCKALSIFSSSDRLAIGSRADSACRKVEFTALAAGIAGSRSGW